jgi:TonB family protein
VTKSFLSGVAAFLALGLLVASLALGQQPNQRNYDKPPVVVHMVEPSYSDEARENHFEGRTVLQVVIDTNGLPTQIKVLSPLGMGLEQKAIECLQKWRFKPGLKNGTPVPVTSTIELNFRMHGSGNSNTRFNSIETARTQYNMGVGALKGVDGKPDYAKAVELFLKAGSAGFAPAQFALTKIYLDGVGLPRDPHQAAEWCDKAAKQGLDQAEFMAGVLAANGEGVPRDESVAAKWYRKAAEQGHLKAEYNLGIAYESGRGIKQDYREAIKWLRKSADRGLADSQYELGLLYRDGNGVQKDPVTALLWLTESANQSFNPAVIARSQLAETMSPGEIAAMERLLSEKGIKK